MSKGLREILRGDREYFTMEYPCDTPTEKRWFKAEVRPMKINLLRGAVVMHINISGRKQVEAEILLINKHTEEIFKFKDLDIIWHRFIVDDPNIHQIGDRIFGGVNMPDELDKPLLGFIEKILIENLGLTKEDVEGEISHIKKNPKPFGWWQVYLRGVKLGKFYILKSDQKIALHCFDDLKSQNKSYILHYLRIFRKFN